MQVLGWAYLRDARLQPTSTQLQLLRDAAAQASSNPMLWEVLGDAVAATSSSGEHPQCFPTSTVHGAMPHVAAASCCHGNSVTVSLRCIAHE